MQVLLPPEIQEQLISALRAAGRREIGGILMGEHVGANAFRVVSVTIQTRGGAFASFVRLVQHVVRPLADFFRKTSHQYTRFNYLGEWHSHHSFELNPSTTDAETMRELVDDPEVGATFAVLLILRLDGDRDLRGSVTVFLPEGRVDEGALFLQGEGVHR